MRGSYARFAAMILTSTAIMFGLMYSLVYSAEHVWFADTRFFMALYMGAMMTVVMLAFMLSMYPSKRTNISIVIGAAVVVAITIYLARSQRTVGDVAYMKAMIPHTRSPFSPALGRTSPIPACANSPIALSRRSNARFSKWKRSSATWSIDTAVHDKQKALWPYAPARCLSTHGRISVKHTAPAV